jgi:hypothetical protein
MSIKKIFVMKTLNFLAGLTVVFAIAFISCSLATLGWNYFTEGMPVIDWNTSFALATILAVVTQIGKLNLKKRLSKYAGKVA